MRLLTEQNTGENEAVYNQECSRPIAGIFYRWSIPFRVSYERSYWLDFYSHWLRFYSPSPTLLNTFMLLARLCVGFLHALRVMRCPVHISRFCQTRRRLDERRNKGKQVGKGWGIWVYVQLHDYYSPKLLGPSPGSPAAMTSLIFAWAECGRIRS